MKKISGIMTAMLICLALLGGCTKKPVETEPVTTAETSSTAPETTEETSAEAPELHIPSVPYGIHDIEFRDPEGALSIRAVVTDAVTEEGYGIDQIDVCRFADGRLAAFYLLRYSDEAYSRFISLIDTEYGMFGTTVELGDGDLSIFTRGDYLWVSDYIDDHCVYTAYDSSLEQVFRAEEPFNVRMCVSEDGRIYCSIKDGYIQVMDIAVDEEAHSLELDRMFSAEGIDGIFTAPDGRKLVAVTGIAGDLGMYCAMFDLADGTTVSLQDRTSMGGYTAGESGYPMHCYDGDSITLTRILKGDVEYTYRYGDGAFPDVSILPDGRIFASVTIDHEDGGYSLQLGLYGTDGALIASAEMPSRDDYSYVSFMPFAVDEHTLMIELDTEVSREYWYWDISSGAETGDVLGMEIVPFEPVIADIEETYTMEDITPRECTEELAPMKALAERLGKDNGIDIYIGDECRMIGGGYVFYPLNDPDEVEDALDVAAEFFAMYPEGFFTQFGDGSTYYTGLDLYITSTLKGISPDGLAYAGGVTFEDGPRLKIAIDCSMMELNITDFHHEFCHAIDRKINATDGLWLDLTSWNELNPADDCYFGNYDSYMYGVGSDYLYNNTWLYTEHERDDVYFIDDYALSNDEEDRARLFEFFMTDYIDFGEFPHLQAKLNALAGYIREAFVLNGDNIPWEKYMG